MTVMNENVGGRELFQGGKGYPQEGEMDDYLSDITGDYYDDEDDPLNPRVDH